jgi:hypothetical protein
MVKCARAVVRHILLSIRESMEVRRGGSPGVWQSDFKTVSQQHHLLEYHSPIVKGWQHQVQQQSRRSEGTIAIVHYYGGRVWELH